MRELMFLAWSMPGAWEWAAIGLVVLLFFGNRIPKVARSLGASMTEFKRGLRDGVELKRTLDHERREITEALKPHPHGD